MSSAQRILWTLPVLILVTLTFQAPALAQPPPGTDRVEEDWELVVGTPSPLEAGPQITTTMSPDGDNAATFFAFNLNYRDAPFRAGGLQVRAFWGKSEIASPDTQRDAACRNTGETITWTQRLTLAGGVASYDIMDGQSQTWGAFGQGDNLRIAVTTARTGLSAYSPAASVAGSGVGWQSNRVDRMTLRRIRYYAGGNLLAIEETPRNLLGGSPP